MQRHTASRKKQAKLQREQWLPHALRQRLRWLQPVPLAADVLGLRGGGEATNDMASSVGRQSINCSASKAAA